MTSYGMSNSSRQPGHEASSHSFGSGNWYNPATSSHPRSGEPTVYLSYGGPNGGGGYGGYGSCGGPSSHGRMSCYTTPGGPGSYGGFGGSGGGYGGFGGPGGRGGPGGNMSWCSPRPYSSPQWGPSWGN